MEKDEEFFSMPWKVPGACFQRLHKQRAGQGAWMAKASSKRVDEPRARRRMGAGNGTLDGCPRECGSKAISWPSPTLFICVLVRADI